MDQSEKYKWSGKCLECGCTGQKWLNDDSYCEECQEKIDNQ